MQPENSTKTRVLSREEWEHMKLLERMHEVIPKKEGSDFRGLVFNPRGIKFATQNKNEEIFILLRRHWFTNLSWVFNVAIFFTMPIIVITVVLIFGIDLRQLLGFKILTLLGLIWYSAGITYALRSFMEWYYNVFIVTDERVLDLTFVPLQSRDVAETNLASIENVQEKSIGFLPNLLGYGDVNVFTAADNNIITFDSVPDPTLVRDRVADLAKILREKL